MYKSLRKSSLGEIRNKNKRPSEKISDLQSVSSKHSGLANIGVPPLLWEPAEPKSVNATRKLTRSNSPLRYFTT